MAEQAAARPELEAGEIDAPDDDQEFTSFLDRLVAMAGHLEAFTEALGGPLIIVENQPICQPEPTRNPYDTLPNVLNTETVRAQLRKFLRESTQFLADFRAFDHELRTSRNLRDEYRRNRNRAANMLLRFQAIAVLRQNFLPALAERLFPEQIPTGLGAQTEAHIKGLYASHLTFVLHEYMERFKNNRRLTDEEEDLQQASMRAILQLVINRGGDDARMRKIFKHLRDYEQEMQFIRRIMAVEPHTNIIRYYVCSRPYTSTYVCSINHEFLAYRPFLPRASARSRASSWWRTLPPSPASSKRSEPKSPARHTAPGSRSPTWDRPCRH